MELHEIQWNASYVGYFMFSLWTPQTGFMGLEQTIWAMTCSSFSHSPPVNWCQLREAPRKQLPLFFPDFAFLHAQVHSDTSCKSLILPRSWGKTNAFHTEDQKLGNVGCSRRDQSDVRWTCKNCFSHWVVPSAEEGESCWTVECSEDAEK